MPAELSPADLKDIKELAGCILHESLVAEEIQAAVKAMQEILDQKPEVVHRLIERDIDEIGSP